jgi:foldase protein PrsA
MGDTMHTMAADKTGRRNKTVVYLLGGAACALLVGGLALQFSRPTPAFPGETAAPARAAVSGEAPKEKRRALAKVGKDYLFYDQVADEAVARHGQEILENMINRTIIQQACAQQGIEVTEAEVDAEILSISKKFGLAVDQWLKMLQAERGVTIDQYRKDIIWPMLALRKLAGVNVQLTKDDMQKAFQRNYGPRVKARAIVLDNPRRATEVWEKARQTPEEFGRLARTHSVDPNSRPLDGAIPPIRMFGGAPELEKAAFKLKPGEISGVIQVGVNQYVILQCDGFTEQVVTDMAEVESILKQELHEEKTNEAVAQTFQKLKDASRVDNYLTRTSSGGTAPKSAAASPVKDSQVQPVGGTAAPRATATQRPAAAPTTRQ